MRGVGFKTQVLNEGGGGVGFKTQVLNGGG